MSQTPPVDSAPNQRQKSLQSRNAPKPALLPALPTPFRKVSIFRRVWHAAILARLRPNRTDLKGPDPGLAVMAEIDLIRRDLAQYLPADPHLKRLLIRHDSLMREGEGVAAGKEADDIDAYVAEQAIKYARLRRKEQRQKGINVTSSVAFSAIEHTPDRKSVAVITFSITGAGYPARGAVRILIQ
jgi:hypothetical protein